MSTPTHPCQKTILLKYTKSGSGVIGLIAESHSQVPGGWTESSTQKVGI